MAGMLTIEIVADVPPAFPLLSSRKSPEELDMDKVTAAMVLTSLSTSPLVRSPPIRPNGKPCCAEKPTPGNGGQLVQGGRELKGEEWLCLLA